jgi:hypothetical protein
VLNSLLFEVSSTDPFIFDLAVPEFSVVDQQTGEVVLTKPVEQTTTRLGNCQTLNFSEVREPGVYAIKAGYTLTRSFRIGDDAWNSGIWKAINFMYSERCGAEILGIHGRCHQDIYTLHRDEGIVVNGGYHDAGDLSPNGKHAWNGLRHAFARGKFEGARRRSGSHGAFVGRSEVGLELGLENALWRWLTQHWSVSELLDRPNHRHSG